MERTKEPLSREHCTSQHALHGARLEIYDSSRRKATKQGAEKIEVTKQKKKKKKGGNKKLLDLSSRCRRIHGSSGLIIQRHCEYDFYLRIFYRIAVS